MNKYLRLVGLTLFVAIQSIAMCGAATADSRQYGIKQRGIPSLLDLCRKNISQRAPTDAALKQQISTQLPAELALKLQEPVSIAHWKEHFTNCTNSICWLDSCHLLYFGFFDSKVFEIGQKNPVAVKDMKNTDFFCAGQTSPDNKFVIVSSGKHCRIIDLKEKNIRLDLKQRCAPAISPDSTHYAIASANGIIHGCINEQTAYQLNRAPEDKGMIEGMAFSPNNQILAYGSGFGTLYLLTLNTGAATKYSLPQSLDLEKLYVSTLSFSPNGQWLAVGFSQFEYTKTTEMLIIDLFSGKQYIIHTCHMMCPQLIRWAPDNKHFATLNIDGNIDVWTAPGYIDDTSSQSAPNTDQSWRQQMETHCDGHKQASIIMRALCFSKRFYPLLVCSQDIFDSKIALLTAGLPQELEAHLRDLRSKVQEGF